MLTWIAFSLLCAATLCLTGWCAESAISRRRVPRRAIWFTVMVASVAVPIAASIVAGSASPTPTPSTISATATTPSNPVTAQPTASGNIDLLIVALWALTSLAITTWLLALHVALRRRLRGCVRTTVAGASQIVSPDFGPAVVGVFRPDIVLPEWSLSLTAADRTLVLTHEMEHTRAHDPALHFAGLALTVLFPWNLALWWQLSRLRLAIEIDCDNRVVRDHAEDPARYGQLLLHARTLGSMGTQGGLALTLHRSAIARRIEALMTSRRRPVSRVIGSSVVAAFLTAAVAFAPAPPLPHLVISGATPPHVQPPAGTLTRTVAAAPTTVIRRIAPVKRAARTVNLVGSLPHPQLTRSEPDAELTRFTMPVPPRVPVTAMRGGSIIIRAGAVGTFGDGAQAGGFGRGGAGALTGPRDITQKTNGVVARLIKRDTTPPGR
jgi:beta-lactamase regulating signal transducer with metallopeptidase domain